MRFRIPSMLFRIYRCFILRKLIDIGMDNDITDEFFKWLDASGLKPKDVAGDLGNGWQTVSSWRSKGVPKGKQLACRALMDKAHQKQMEELRNNLILRPTYDQLKRWNQAALDNNQLIEDWAFDGLEAMADECFSPLSVVSEEGEAVNKPNLSAAAGSGIEADLVDWVEGSRVLSLQLHGLSASPLFDDQQVIEMAPKHLAKGSRDIAKGKFYLVRYEGKLLFKRYNTRMALTTELDADYLTKTGKVGLLESVNPDFPTIEITNQEFEWLAWLEKDGSYPKDLKK